MEIGIIRLSVLGGKSTNNGYNYQCIGLAKALARLGNKVFVYRCIDRKWEAERIVSNNCLTIYEIPVRTLGTNGLLNPQNITEKLDVCILMSDTQLGSIKVINWAKKKGVRLFNYIGVVESHSNNNIIKFAMNLYIKQLMSKYKTCKCLAKTPQIKKILIEKGVTNVSLMPVGLDSDLLYKDYYKEDRCKLKTEFGYNTEDKILLFIGRLVEEKDPLRMVQLFDKLSKRKEGVKLLIIGDGYLRRELDEYIIKIGKTNSIEIIKGIPNDEIWKAYRVADCLVNLNKQEIFGMVLLEAMFYECPIVACDAPGPRYILEDTENALLVEDDEIIMEIEKRIERRSEYTKMGREKVINSFLWDSIAEKYVDVFKV